VRTGTHAVTTENPLFCSVHVQIRRWNNLHTTRPFSSDYDPSYVPPLPVRLRPGRSLENDSLCFSPHLRFVLGAAGLKKIVRSYLDGLEGGTQLDACAGGWVVEDQLGLVTDITSL
jgi:hypothetical protein